MTARDVVSIIAWGTLCQFLAQALVLILHQLIFSRERRVRMMEGEKLQAEFLENVRRYDASVRTGKGVN